MSKSTTPDDSSDSDTLTDDEQSVFQRLADRHAGDDVGRIAQIVLQSASDESEEANS